MEFWHQLASKPSTCNDEAFHGFLLYLDGQDPNTDYNARVAVMKSRGLIAPGFTGAANNSVTRGDLAVVIMRSLRIKGGVTNRLMQSYSPRYATRELVYLNLYPPSSSPNQTFSGSEFVGIVGRIEDWQRGNSVDQPAAVLSGESK